MTDGRIEEFISTDPDTIRIVEGLDLGLLDQIDPDTGKHKGKYAAFTLNVRPLDPDVDVVPDIETTSMYVVTKEGLLEGLSALMVLYEMLEEQGSL